MAKKKTTRKKTSKKATKKKVSKKPKKKSKSVDVPMILTSQGAPFVGADRIFIFDANFFITLKQTHSSEPYRHLYQVLQEQDMKFVVSAMVFNECPFIKGKTFQNFAKAVDIILVPEDDLRSIKKALHEKGIMSSAQDPDLTLVALANMLNTSKNKITIVSDDYKLSQNVKALQNYDLNFIGLPAFLQYLRKKTSGKLSQYFKKIHDKTLRSVLDYMMERADRYPPQAKMMWLLKNAISVEEGDVKTDINDFYGDAGDMFQICEKYLSGKKISESDHKIISPHLDYLEFLKKCRSYLSKITKIMDADPKTAFKKLNLLVSQKLMPRMEELIYDYKGSDLSFFRKHLAMEIARAELTQTFNLISVNNHKKADSSFKEVAFYTSLAENPKANTNIHYFRAVMNSYNGEHSKAFKIYQKVRLLARKQDDIELEIKCMIAESIAKFMDGDHGAALDITHEIREMTKGMNLEEGMNAFMELGAFYYSFGWAEISSPLFTDALECAIDGGLKNMYRPIMNEVKKSFAATMYLPKIKRPTSGIDALINEAHILVDEDEFNDVFAEFANFTGMIYQEFEHITKGKAVAVTALNDDVRFEYECLYFHEDMELDKLIIVAYNQYVGIIAFRVKMKLSKLKGLPLEYKVRLKSTGRAQVSNPDEILKSLFLIRAVVDVSPKSIVVERNPPVFFSSLTL